jgi:hypothetical protein
MGMELSLFLASSGLNLLEFAPLLAGRVPTPIQPVEKPF